MKPKENFLEDLLLTKVEDPHKKGGKIFPLGYTDKRTFKKRKKRRAKKSINSLSSGSSESIEEKNEELEEDDYIKIKNNSDPEKKNEILIDDDNFKLFPLNEDSDSEIVEEEIISEETIAKIYANKTDEILEKDNINIQTDIIPISETLIVNTNKTKEVENKKNSEDKVIKEKKRKIYKNKDNILFKYFNHKSLISKLRIITLIILIIYIILLTTNIFIYAFSKTKLTIFCFEFVPSEEANSQIYYYKIFLSDRISFIIIQLLCLIPFISIIISLLKNEYLPLKQFFKAVSFYFPLTLSLIILIIIIEIKGIKHNN